MSEARFTGGTNWRDNTLQTAIAGPSVTSVPGGGSTHWSLGHGGLAGGTEDAPGGVYHNGCFLGRQAGKMFAQRAIGKICMMALAGPVIGGVKKNQQYFIRFNKDFPQMWFVATVRVEGSVCHVQAWRVLVIFFPNTCVSMHKAMCRIA